MLYQQDLSSTVSTDDANFSALVAQLPTAVQALKTKHQQGLLPVLDLPQATEDIQVLQKTIHNFNFPNIFVLGTGGSSLGGRSLCDLTQFPFYQTPGKSRVHFLDNIDPHTVNGILQNHDIRQTGFIVISKSGSTAETMCQFLLVMQKSLQVLSADELTKHFIVITEPKQNPMRKIAEQHKLPVFDHHPTIGGRFSVLSLVGLLPAMIAGVDVTAVRKGAAQILDETFNTPPTARAAIGAAYAVYMMRKGLPIMVMMPYCDRLKSFSAWYCQLWAESVGKQGQGSTPVPALGTVDQHSQLQLFLDGPKDKAYTLIFLDYYGTGGTVSSDVANISELEYLKGKTMGDLMAAEQQATAQTLINQNCPTRLIRVPQLDEEGLGALMMHFMLETMLAAELMGINAYDQPAVEESKILTRQYLAAGGA